MPNTIKLDTLAFSPHPDDAELFCGGLLASLSDKGYLCGICDLTRGELGSQGTPDIRAEEAALASDALKLSYRMNLGLPDGGLGEAGVENSKPDSQLAKIVSQIRTLQPTLVLAPYWEERHPDHVETSRLVTKASFFSGVKNYLPELGKSFAPSQLLYYPLRQLAKPSFVADITAVYHRKLAGIHAHKSQITREFGHDAPSVPTLISSPLSLQSIQSRDEFYGAMIGVKYGEAFITRSMLRIDDPQAFFKDSATEPALLFPER